MAKRKKIRTRGKFSLSRYFQRFKKGEIVAVAKEEAVTYNFPKSIQGRTGVIGKKRGKSYFVSIKIGRKNKEYLIEPIHLKKIKN